MCLPVYLFVCNLYASLLSATGAPSSLLLCPPLFLSVLSFLCFSTTVQGEMDALEKLYMSGNVLSSVPQTVRALLSLDELYVSDNEITELPPLPANLTKLYADKNHIWEIDAALAESPKLEILHVNDNRLRHFPTTLPFKSLKFIHISQNDILEPAEAVALWLDQIAQLEGLRVLEVEDNPCWSYPPSGTSENAKIPELENKLEHVKQGMVKAWSFGISTDIQV